MKWAAIDLCVSAALDAVKEDVTLPWTVPKVNPTEIPATSAAPELAQSASDAGLSAPGEGREESSPKPAVEHEADAEGAAQVSSEKDLPQRVLYLRHFTKALKEITPSSSESLGSLAALRKWNEEFGEGQKKKRKVMWGKGLFGFSEPGSEKALDGRVHSEP